MVWDWLPTSTTGAITRGDARQIMQQVEHGNEFLYPFINWGILDSREIIYFCLSFYVWAGLKG